VLYEDSEGNLQRITDLGSALAAAPQLQARTKLDIPTPKITTVDTYEHDISADVKIPESYVRYSKIDGEDFAGANGSGGNDVGLVDYNCDLEDEAWLETTHGRYEQKTESSAPTTTVSRPLLTLPLFEQMLDLLEKSTGFKTIIRLNQAEQLFTSKLNVRKSTTTTAIMNDVYNYWVQKRCNLKKPLLRRYWPVTASNDCNPHLVFRPREKEKYTLRKKRKNDMDAFKKMQLLKRDFERVRMLLDLVRRREKLLKLSISVREDLFQQLMYDTVDTSGLERSSRLDLDLLDKRLKIPKLKVFGSDSKLDSSGSGYNNSKKKKRKREGSHTNLMDASSSAASNLALAGIGGEDASSGGQGGSSSEQPVPLFTQSLPSREHFVSSWNNAVPYVTNYVDAQKPSSSSSLSSIMQFRHRGRIGRGGRLCIDRLPCVRSKEAAPTQVYYTGDGPVHAATNPARTLLELVTPPLDKTKMRTKIEEICATWSDDDEEELVKTADWLETDEQLWGTERLAVGPL